MNFKLTDRGAGGTSLQGYTGPTTYDAIAAGPQTSRATELLNAIDDNLAELRALVS